MTVCLAAALLALTAATDAASAQQAERKSNGTLEIIAVYAPDFLVFTVAEGQEIQEVAVYFVSASDSFRARKMKMSNVTVKDAKNGKWDTSFTDETEIRAMDFNVPDNSFFAATRIKFVVDGTDMFYDLEKDRWKETEEDANDN